MNLRFCIVRRPKVEALLIGVLAMASSLSAQPAPSDPKPVPSAAMERLADQRKGLSAHESGDPKAYKRYRAAGRKAEKKLDVAAAEKHYAAAVHVAEGFSPTDDRLGESLADWGRVVFSQRKFRQAQRIYEDLAAFQERIHGAEHISLVGPLVQASTSASYADRFDVAEKGLLRARTIAELRLGAYHHYVGYVLGSLGSAYALARRDAEAEAAFQKALQILQARKSSVELGKSELARYVQKADYASAAGVMNDLALLYLNQKRYPEAEETFKRALAHYEREVGKKSEGVATILNNLGALYRLQKDFPQADSYLTRSLALREKLLGPNHLLVGDTLSNIALLRIDQGNSAEAARLNERAQAIRAQARGGR